MLIYKAQSILATICRLRFHVWKKELGRGGTHANLAGRGKRIYFMGGLGDKNARENQVREEK